MGIFIENEGGEYEKLYSGILFGLALAFIVPLSVAYAEEARDETDAFKKSI